MAIRRKAIASALAVAAVATGVLLAWLGHPEKQENQITMSASSKSTLAYQIYAYGQEKGIFDKHGVNVTFIPLKDLYTMELTFFSGKVDTIINSAGLSAVSYNEGEKFKIGIAIARSGDLMLLAQPGIADVQDLRGRKLGVQGRTSDAYYIIKWWLESKGIDIENDLEVIEIKSGANLVTSFKTGQLDAAVLWSGYAYEVKSSGGIPVISTSDALEELTDVPHYNALLLFRDDFLENKKSVANKFLRAVREITEEMNANIDEAAEIAARQSEEPLEKVRGVLSATTIVGDLDEEIQDEILSFFRYAAEKGYFDKAPGSEIFYDEWR